MYDPAFTSAALNILNGGETSMAGSLLIATLLGALVGLERSVAGKHAGMRTYALVSLGSCLFVIVGTIASQAFLPFFPGVNPLQIAGSIVIGIGFIGSGMAAFARHTENHMEITTTAGIWVIAGVGMACGFGLYFLALVSAVLAAATFSLFLRVENVVRKKYPTDSTVG